MTNRATRLEAPELRARTLQHHPDCVSSSSKSINYGCRWPLDVPI